MKNSIYHSKYYRRPKTTQEAKYSCDEDHKQYIRGKRSYKNLPNSYDDLQNTAKSDKSWKRKSKAKHQSRVLNLNNNNRKSRKNSLIFNDNDISYKQIFDFEDYCDRLDIPYKVIKKYRIEYRTREIEKFIQTGIEPVYSHYKKNNIGQPRLLFYRTLGYWEKTGVFKRYKIKTPTTIQLMWWSNKDIGIDKILNASKFTRRIS